MHKLSRLVYAACAVATAIAHQSCALNHEGSVDPSISTPLSESRAASWQKITPGGDTVCSDGSEYSFYTHTSAEPEGAKQLLFYLQGGGGCWNTQTCDPLGQPSYTVNLDGFDPSQADGIFNFSRADNPLRGHTIVFVPYCSGDVHIGDVKKTYERSEGWIKKLQERGVASELIKPQFNVAHNGLRNAQAALDWVKAEVKKPESILVAGSSAGSIPSPYYAVQIARAYPEAQVSQLGDGSGGYRRMGETASPHLAWNTVEALQADPAFRGLRNDTFNFEALYIAAHAAEPALRLRAYDTAEDDIQLEFLQLSGLEVPSLHEAIKLNQRDIRTAAPTFRSYVAAGELHTILRRPEFYEYSVGSISFRDWLADLVAGKDIEDVTCQEC